MFDGEDEQQQEEDIQQLQQEDTRPRPKWYRSTIQDSGQVDLPARSFRRSVPPERLSYMALITELINSEPSSFEGDAQHEVWQEAMVEEYDSVMKNQVWEVVSRPEGKKVVGSRWIYKVKHSTKGSVEKYKAYFMAKRFHIWKVLTMRRPPP